MKLGDYQLNDIYCGDSAVMLKALPDACIDLTVTSPPYDNLRDYLVDKVVVWGYNIPHEKKQEIIRELRARGIKPIPSP